MAIVYDKMFKIFQERGITSYTFKKNKLIGQGTWVNLKNGGHIDTRTLNTLCKYLDCRPGDLIDYVPDEDA